MRILVTNDDGILAPGIRALVTALRTIAEVIVIAPDRNNSGVSSAISLDMPLRVTEVRENWYQLNGTPADCIKLGLSGFLKVLPDMVVSGINAGANLGDDVLYSGTVGGAFEGRYLPYPPIAMSCVYEGFEGETGEWYYETAAKVAIDLVNRVITRKFPEGTLLNVNVPNIPLADLKGTKITRQGERHFSEPLIPHTDGRGKPIYWVGKAGKVKDDSEGTDFHATKECYVSVTPMHVDFTRYQHLDEINDLLV